MIPNRTARNVKHTVTMKINILTAYLAFESGLGILKHLSQKKKKKGVQMFMKVFFFIVAKH